MIITWEQAEEVAQHHMRLLGFSDAQRTAGGVDRGLDVIATGAVAQVKHLGVPVGAPDVQRFRGAAYNVRNALFYSSSGYTKAAVSAAEVSEVALYIFTGDGEVNAVNGHARDLRPPRLRTAIDDERALIFAEIVAVRLRQRAWAVSVRRRDDGTHRQGSGPDPEPSRLVILQTARHHSFEEGREWVEAARLKIMDCGLALNKARGSVRDTQTADWVTREIAANPGLEETPIAMRMLAAGDVNLADIRRDVAALSLMLDGFEREMTAWHGGLPKLRQLVRPEAREFKRADPDVYVNVSEAVCLP